jgi:DNA primase
MDDKQASTVEAPPGELDASFRPLPGKSGGKAYRSYLERRGFAPGWGSAFELHYAPTGPFQGRIIVPVRNWQGSLVGWTGRTISRRAEPRYLAYGDITHHLPWAHRLKQAGGRLLVITEGPFDALKVNALGNELGIAATCVFTSQASEHQRGLIIMLAQRFAKTVVCFDQGNEASAYKLAAGLPGVTAITLPLGVKDPGELRDPAWLRHILGRFQGDDPKI